MEIVGGQSVLNELPAGPALFSAGSQHRPDASIPLSAHQGSAALGNSPINNSLTKSLLSSIVGRWNSRVKQKPEHSVTMLAETLSECSRLGWQVLLLGQGQYSILDFEHNPVESVLWDSVSKMPDMKEPLELNQQALSKAFVGLIGVRSTKRPSKILLGTHGVLKMNNGEHDLLCKEGSKGLSLIGRDGGAEILAFAETNKFVDIEKKEDVESVAVNGFSYSQENGSIGIASKLERSGIRMDVIPKSLIDYLITEKDIY